MAGPSLSGPLTGWTASALVPVAAAIIAPRKQSPAPPPGMPDPSTLTAAELEGWGRWEDAAVRRNEEIKARKATASALEKEAQATKDPAKFRAAWDAYKRTAADDAGPVQFGKPENARVEALHKLAVDFKKRNPSFEFASDPTGFNRDQAIFDAPEGKVRSYLSQKLFDETGFGTGTNLDTDTYDSPLLPRRTGAVQANLGGSGSGGGGGGGGDGGGGGGGQQSDVIGGAGPAFLPGQVAGAAGGPSLSGPSSGWTPEVSMTAPVTPPVAGSAGGRAASATAAYDLTADELASGGPDPRASVAPKTPLEQLLRTIYPDAPTTGADPLADPRNPGAGPSGFADVLAYITNQGGGSPGYVPSPVLAGGGGGAQIASTIPGAPSFLPGAINNLSSPPVFAQAPVQSFGGGNTLVGLAAISAEQRVQQAQLVAEQKKRDDAYFAQKAAEDEARRRAAQFASLQSGFTSPSPVTSSGWNSSPMIVNGIQVGQRPY